MHYAGQDAEFYRRLDVRPDFLGGFVAYHASQPWADLFYGGMQNTNVVQENLNANTQFIGREYTTLSQAATTHPIPEHTIRPAVWEMIQATWAGQ